MILRKWDDLPQAMKNESVRRYYDILSKKKTSIFIKRIFDIAASIIGLVILSPVFLVLSILIKADSKGTVLFRQTRVTRYGRLFTILKFRTMVENAESIGSQVTTSNDARVTRIGRLIRKCRLDEIPQLINILKGDMSFVGTRPEVVKYVDMYTEEMMATLLLPAGVTSTASIEYKDEECLLYTADDADEVYVKSILPCKMEYNLSDITRAGVINDLKTIIKTVIKVFGTENRSSKPISLDNDNMIQYKNGMER